VEIIANTDGGNSVYTWYLNGMPTGTGGPDFPVTAFGTYHVGVENEDGCRAVSGEITFSDCCASGTCGTGTPSLPGGCIPLTHDLIAGIAEIDCRRRQCAADPSGIEPGSLRWHVLSASTGLLDVGTGTDYAFSFPAPGYYQVILTGLLTGFPYTG